MLTAIGTANTATDDTTALTALREAADLYAGDFAALEQALRHDPVNDEL